MQELPKPGTPEFEKLIQDAAKKVKQNFEKAIADGVLPELHVDGNSTTSSSFSVTGKKHPKGLSASEFNALFSNTKTYTTSPEMKGPSLAKAAMEAMQKFKDQQKVDGESLLTVNFDGQLINFQSMPIQNFTVGPSGEIVLGGYAPTICHPKRYFDPENPVKVRIGDCEFVEEFRVCWDCEDRKHQQSVANTQADPA